MPESPKIIIPDHSPSFSEYKEFFRGKNLREGVESFQPVQYEIPAERFGNQFYLWYQVEREDSKGEIYSFRAFYRDVNGANIRTWLDNLHKYYVHKHVRPLGKKEPVEVKFCESPHVHNQVEFYIFQMPGKYAEMLIDTYFQELKAHL